MNSTSTKPVCALYPRRQTAGVWDPYQTPRWQWRLSSQLPFSGHTRGSGALRFSTVKHSTQAPLSSERIPANSATLLSAGSSSPFPLPVIEPPQVTDQFHFKYIFWAHLLSQVLYKALSYQGAGKKYGWWTWKVGEGRRQTKHIVWNSERIKQNDKWHIAMGYGNSWGGD